MGLQETMKLAEKSLLTKNTAEFRPGDTVSVALRILEGDKERVQAFAGVVVQKRGNGMGATFTVRKPSGSVYVERTFPLHSPLISEIKLVRKGSVRRSKLYYLRDISGKSTRIKEMK